MISKELADVVVDALHEMKGQSVVCIDVNKLTEITDYMVIVTGTSSTHLKALADEVITKVKEAGGRVNGMEGRMQAEWILVDLGGVVVHIMLAPVRALYNLEDLWNFASESESQEDKKAAAGAAGDEEK
ncbi:MAG: ribosome silencing factor [Gammaproteobacteria bacterium]|nr:ribosome silencing factor [Gammaproteobacteria bacterium]